MRDSDLRTAVLRIEDDLRGIAEDGDLILTVTDPDARILWTWVPPAMRSGVRAIGGQPSAQPGWERWAAAVHDPVTGAPVGRLELTAQLSCPHPIGSTTARLLARLIERALPAPVLGPTAGLSLTLLGRAEATLDGGRLVLTRRQAEILALLALNPDGLSLEHLHARLYGDQPVTHSTLKAEVSHLRRALGGRLASRPYRLTLPVRCDVEAVLRLLRSGRVGAAVAAYGGDLLAGTNSPALIELGDYLAVAVREALLSSPEPDAVLRYSDLVPYDTAVVESCLRSLDGADHPAIPLLKGRLAAARR